MMGRAAVVMGLVLLGCSSSSEDGLGGGGSGASSGSSMSGGTGGGLGLSTGSGAGNTGGGNTGSGGGACDAVLEATIRDFQESHPDFETFSGNNAFTGIVEDILGTDLKPVYAHAGGTAQTTGPAEFAQWYHNVDGVNQAFPVSLVLTEQNGSLVYDDSTFFPIDDQG
ncbi:MAG: hypothetical protein KC731_16510, partial [Myxococcales bacterium]|nr:hypothetical protein [Myxococcales bacterium]